MMLPVSALNVPPVALTLRSTLLGEFKLMLPACVLTRPAFVILPLPEFKLTSLVALAKAPVLFTIEPELVFNVKLPALAITP